MLRNIQSLLAFGVIALIHIATSADPVTPKQCWNKIVFESTRDGNSEIYIMNLDGSSQRNVSNSPSDEHDPVVSPEGKKICFESYRDRNNDIFIINVDGSELTRLTSSEAVDKNPCFSPDGTKIAFASDRDGNYEIYTMNIDGTGQKRLSSNESIDDRPLFLPEGNMIIYYSWSIGKSSGFYIMDADGLEEPKPVSGDQYVDYSVISPDDRKILITLDDKKATDIYIVNTETGEQTALTEIQGHNYSPSFAPMLINGKLLDYYGHWHEIGE